MEGGDLDLGLQTGGEASAGAGDGDELRLARRTGVPPPGRRGACGSARSRSIRLVRFQKMTIAFVRSPGALEIRDAIIFNPNMGLTTEGSIDFARNTIDLSGTFIPAYSVNTFSDKIPLRRRPARRRAERGRVRHLLSRAGAAEPTRS